MSLSVKPVVCDGTTEPAELGHLWSCRNGAGQNFVKNSLFAQTGAFSMLWCALMHDVNATSFVIIIDISTLER